MPLFRRASIDWHSLCCTLVFKVVCCRLCCMGKWLFIFLCFFLKDLKRNRESDKLRLINELPNLAQQIKEQWYVNTELDTELTVLQHILEYAKEENMALEVISIYLNPFPHVVEI